MFIFRVRCWIMEDKKIGVRGERSGVSKGILFLLFFLTPHPSPLTPSLWAFRPDRFRVGVLRYAAAEDHDPYPTVWRDLGRLLEQATSIETDPLVKEIISPTPRELAAHALIFWVTSPNFRSWSAAERQALKNWVRLGGGMIVVTGAEGIKSAANANDDQLDAKVRREIEAIFEGSSLEVVASTHAVFRSFYLVNQAGGVLIKNRSLVGIKTGERYGLVYSRNDLLGTLLRDQAGVYLFGCYPGGETQRKESVKLLVNIVVYALTGTYKQDVIHLPFIEQKLRLRRR
ncbi:MAG: DUF4159 domain-containing protein [Elusimicrobia bacterium]|nr:DUF4159 domain-containing protein [Elusimicrobiota bacterium]